MLLKCSDMLLFSPLGAITPPGAYGVNFSPCVPDNDSAHRNSSSCVCLRSVPALGQGLPDQSSSSRLSTPPRGTAERKGGGSLLLTTEGSVDYHRPKCKRASSRLQRGFLRCITGGRSQGKGSFKAEGTNLTAEGFVCV